MGMTPPDAVVLALDLGGTQMRACGDTRGRRTDRATGRGCVGWVNAFNPDRIVIGGTLAERQGELWLSPARDLVA